MKIELLNEENLKALVDFEEEARVTEPGILYGDFYKEEFYNSTLKALKNPAFSSARTLLCWKGNKIISRLDFCMVPSFAFSGDIRAYVDWIYVLKEYRHINAAKELFKFMEVFLKENSVSSYLLIEAENSEAIKFYGGISDAEHKRQPVLEKNI